MKYPSWARLLAMSDRRRLRWRRLAGILSAVAPMGLAASAGEIAVVPDAKLLADPTVTYQ